MKIKEILVVLLCTGLSPLYAQDTIAPPSEDMVRYKKQIYGLSNLKILDKGVSPLIYSGNSLFLGYGLWNSSLKKETSFNVSFDLGLVNREYQKTSVFSLISIMDVNYQRLYRINALTTNRLVTKIGAMIDATPSIRFTPVYGNAALGLNGEGNVMGALKFTYDVSRKAEKQVKCLFRKRTLQPVRRELSFL